MSLDDSAFKALNNRQECRKLEKEEAKKVQAKIAKRLEQELKIALGIIVTAESDLATKTIIIEANGLFNYVFASIVFVSKSDSNDWLSWYIQLDNNTNGQYMIHAESLVIIVGLKYCNPKELSEKLLLDLGRFFTCLKNNMREK